MTAIATLPVLLQTGNHAGRPAASAVGSGALYNCTTHGLVYQQLAGSWGTWLTLPSAGLSDPMTTRGDIIVRNASNVTARLAHGSADTYLGSDGTDVAYSAVTDAKLSTSDITTNNASTSKHGFLKKLDNDSTHFMDGTGAWAVPAGGSSGGLVLLEHHTASTSASLDFTTFYSSTYDDYLVEIVNLLPATDQVTPIMLASTNGGSTWLGGTTYAYRELRYTSSTVTIASDGAASLPLDGYAAGLVGNTANQGGLDARIAIRGLGSTTAYKKATVEAAFFDYAGGWAWMVGSLAVKTTTAINALQLKMSSGNITSGDVRIYGFVKT